MHLSPFLHKFASKWLGSWDLQHCCDLLGGLMWRKACPDPRSIRHHYSVMVKIFASGAKVPLAARVCALVGAEVGATPTVLQKSILLCSVTKGVKQRASTMYF